MNTLVVNCGSSSVKVACISRQNEEEIFSILAECLGEENSRIKWNYQGQKGHDSLNGGKHTTAINYLLDLLEKWQLKESLVSIGHRVVHGGVSVITSALIDDAIIQKLEEASPLAPLHNPANIKGMRLMKQAFPKLPQVVVPDTAFAATIPAYAANYAIPYEIAEKYNIRRYGFHGTSHDYLNRQAGVLMSQCGLEGRRIITAHLGNGCSVAVAKDGKCLDTSMGMTPLEGLVMGTRSGTVDPGIFSYLQEQTNMTVDEINQMLNKKSGLLGISGLTNDMRELQQAAEAGHERAQLAIDIFIYVLARQIAAFSVAAKGVDALIFSGGIGENSAYIRQRAVSWLEHFGFSIEDEKNSENGESSNGLISPVNSLPVFVIPTQEEVMIARLTSKVLNN